MSAIEIRRAASIAVPLIAIAALFACESATNLDVAYAPAAVDSGTDGAATPDGAIDPDGAAPTGPEIVEGCPCDPTAGQGCCVTAKDAFCTTDQTACASEKGEFLRCARRDPTSESECCWQGTGAGATTRYAATCNGGASACLTNEDCAGTGQPCMKTECSGFTFGQCAPVPPSCP